MTAAVPTSGFGSYYRLLRGPGAATLALWGTIGRFPIAMRAISCLLLVSAITGSMAAAGTVAAAMLIAQGVASPILGRLADRVSQRRVLLVAGAAHLVGMGSLLVSIALHAPVWVLVLGAVAAGGTCVSFTSFVRARWAALVDHGLLRTAYAMECMLDDTIFLLGPPLVTVVAAALHPAAGLVACLALTSVGSVAVALHHRSEPAIDPTPGHRPRRAITVPGVRVLMVVYAGMGFQFGAIDVTMIAFAQERSAPALGGVFLALTAVGSLVAGAFYGSRNWPLSQQRLLTVTTCLLTLGSIPLAFVQSSPLMAVLALAAGCAISPALITGSTLLESQAPKGSLSEAFSWLTSAGALGIGIGTAVGGQLADLADSSWAAWAAIGGGILALATSVAGHRVLTRGAAVPAPVADLTTLDR